ncbi:MAG: 2-oxo-4-hydroxy-4-carboxy-5-ureidoimidazoline decarboxylase [Actinomycetes bacterium]
MATALERLNSGPDAEARESLRTCLNIPRWVEEMVGGRPYENRDDVLTAAQKAADPFTADEIDLALSRHPRIGERPSGADAESRMSQSEQSGVDPADSEVVERLRAGNQAYEQRFDRVFLIRAAGRDASQILAQLEQRLQNDDETELQVVAEQLREIALLRLEGLLDA